MEGILAIRDGIRDFVRKYNEIVIPVFRFIVYFIVYTSINSMFGYSNLFDRSTVVLLLAIICALVSDPLAMLIAGAVLLVNTLAVATEVGALFLVLFTLMYSLYMRMFPKSCYVLALVPVMMLWGMTYAIPFVVLMTAGAIGIIPTAFGVIIYYFAKYVEEARDALAVKTEEEDFQAFKYIVDNLKDNKDMIALILAFAFVIVGAYVVYRLSINFAWFIAIGVCALMNLVFTSVVGVPDSFGTVFVWTLLGVVIALLLQFCKGIVDYSKKEVVQFEDDEYYYYVKAIPKLGNPQKVPPKNKKKTATNKKVTTGKQSSTNNSSRTNVSAKNGINKGTESVSDGASANIQKGLKTDFVSEAIKENMASSRTRDY